MIKMIKTWKKRGTVKNEALFIKDTQFLLHKLQIKEKVTEQFWQIKQ